MFVIGPKHAPPAMLRMWSYLILLFTASLSKVFFRSSTWSDFHFTIYLCFKPLQNSRFWQGVLVQFWHFITCEECSGGVGIIKFNEMKGRRLTVVKRWLYKNEFHSKVLKEPKMVIPKVSIRSSFLGPVHTMAKHWEEKRLDQWKCRNVQSSSSRPSH